MPGCGYKNVLWQKGAAIIIYDLIDAKIMYNRKIMLTATWVYSYHHLSFYTTHSAQRINKKEILKNTSLKSKRQNIVYKFDVLTNFVR